MALKKKRNWLGKITIWLLKWMLIFVLSIIRWTSFLSYRVANWMLLKLGIDWTTHREIMTGTLRLVKGGKPEEIWKQVGKKKDGMILQRHVRTGDERIIAEKDGKVISYL